MPVEVDTSPAKMVHRRAARAVRPAPDTVSEPVLGISKAGSGAEPGPCIRLIDAMSSPAEIDGLIS